MIPLTWTICALAFASPQDETPAPETPQEETEKQPTPEELDQLFPWRTGEVSLGDGMATLHLPAEFRYLEPEEAKRVLEDVWGNPPAELTWGMVFPADKGPFHEDGWGVVLRYEEDGHVSDDDASEIDYGELLGDMQKDARDSNEERTEAGFGTLEILGWAEHPHYEPTRHELFWAKELQFSEAPVRTLNYDVRLLGRRGVLSMNAVANIDDLPVVRQGMAALLGAIEFSQGNRYQDYDSGTDKLAAYGIGGLIAGKLALKVGLFKGLVALLVAGKKLILVAVVGIGAFFSKVFKKKSAQPAE